MLCWFYTEVRKLVFMHEDYRNLKTPSCIKASLTSTAASLFSSLWRREHAPLVPNITGHGVGQESYATGRCFLTFCPAPFSVSKIRHEINGAFYHKILHVKMFCFSLFHLLSKTRFEKTSAFDAYPLLQNLISISYISQTKHVFMQLVSLTVLV